MLGMTLALRLLQQGKSVTLIEAADRLGGLASAWELGDVRWDRHYHVTLLSDSHLRGLLREIDLEHEIEWVETLTGFYAGRKLYSVSNTLEFLRFPSLNLLQKLRLGATIWYGSRIKDWKRLENVSVEDWLVSLSGRGAFEKFWLPLLRSKLGDNYTITSAAFMWATIQRLYKARRSGMKRELFGYVRGGYARIIERFAEVLEDSGLEIQLGRRVSRIHRGDDGRMVVTCMDGETENSDPASFDKVVVTVAAPLAARICEGLSEEESARLASVKYQGIVCASVLLREPLAGFYVTNLLDRGLPFTGVIEMTTMVDRTYFGGNSLVYLPRYLSTEDPFFECKDEEVTSSFLAGLDQIYPSFNRSQVLAFQISRARFVHALTTLGYSRMVPPMRTSVPGLFTVSSAQIPNGTLNVNETVQLAERAAADLGEGA